jgi:tryptophan synthase alpha subunit
VADGVIVGSALVAVLEEDGDRITRLEHLAGTLRRGIDVS